MSRASRFGLVLTAAMLPSSQAVASPKPAPLPLVNRLSWGVNAPLVEAVQREGVNHWIDRQLKWRGDAPLPAEAQARIDAMRITTTPLPTLLVAMQAQDKAANALTDVDQKKAAKDAYFKALDGLRNEAVTRALLRDVYAPDQLREQLVWFWFNQFNVQASKRDIRVLVGDYEEQAIRPHALGRYRDLLEATLKHPAMLRYLDNDQNAAGKINENYAREIMELHSMGVGSGYTQKDVQELARILTGVGVNANPTPPKLKPEQQPLYVREGLFEFNPARHDFGDKVFLGHTIKGRGFGEVEEALDLIAASPATAHHVSQRLALYFVGDDPPPVLVDRMAAAFARSKGDIPTVLRTMIRAPEFTASLGQGFKDPMHYTVSALRLAYGDRVIVNAQPAIGWLYRLGETPYTHETPDGFPLESAAWSGPGQLNARFEIARSIGAGATGLFRADQPAAAPFTGGMLTLAALIPSPAPAPLATPALPLMKNVVYERGLGGQLASTTRGALDQARNPQEWNALYLSSPDFMRR